jgi:hypothetical protein
MAGTGIVFGLFVLMHMIGNLKAYRENTPDDWGKAYR